MRIFYRKNVLCDISSVDDLEIFVKSKSFYKYFIKFPENKKHLIQKKINETISINYKEIKPWIKMILNYPESIYNPMFLYCMGWDKLEIKKFIEKKQKNNSDILVKKKKKNPELYFSSTTSRVEYWISKGFSPLEAKKKVSERQKTFSKEKCILKYGEKMGGEIFQKRQEKWINSLKSLSNYDEIQIKKNNYLNEKKDFNELINSSSFLISTKTIILKYIENENVDDFVQNVIKEIDIKRYSDILPYYTSKIITKKYEVSVDELKKRFLSLIPYSISKQIYGTPVYHNGIRFKSVKEYKIALFLENLNIKYFYEKNYPNSKYKYDFYLPEKHLYIEYYGMLDGKKDSSLDDKLLFYKSKMIDKNSFCLKNNIPLVQNTNFNELIEDLKKIFYENNN
jgi:hypothetical protein